MNETTTTHNIENALTKIVAYAAVIKTDAAIMGRELHPLERQIIEFVDNMTATHNAEIEMTEGLPTGWLCPRCKAVNAPDVRRCDCEPEVEDNRHYVLGPSETK